MCCLHLSYIFLFDSFDLDLGKLTKVFEMIGRQIILVFLINRLAVVLLLSNVTRVRLLNIAPSAARQLVILITFLGGVLAFDAVLDSIYQIVSASLSLTIAKSFLAVFLVAILLFIISFIPVRFRRRISQSKEKEPRFLAILYTYSSHCIGNIADCVELFRLCWFSAFHYAANCDWWSIFSSHVFRNTKRSSTWN